MFDRIVVVDWSANSAPKLGADSIWIADDRGGRTSVTNLSTRAAAFDILAGVVDDGSGERTLIGVDFSLGYPSGTAAAIGLPGTPWRATWEHLLEAIVDDAGNRNNRFEVAAALNERIAPKGPGGPAGPFWGHPPSWGPDGRLTPTRPRPDVGVDVDVAPPGTWRLAERSLRAAGHRPASSWQLFGAGSVGSQTLVGIPVVERLRRRAPRRVDIWPFTTGLTSPRPHEGQVVVAEVWPTLTAFDEVDHPVRDARQVIAAAAHLRACADDGRLHTLLSPVVPLSWEAPVTSEEGWILGAEVADIGV